MSANGYSHLLWGVHAKHVRRLIARVLAGAL
jgi:hypothetical protein